MSERNWGFEFVEAGIWHGGLERAEEILAERPEIRGELFVAAVLGDDVTVARLVGMDAGCATRKGGPRGCGPLVMLCLSKYLRLDATRSDAFVRAARVLLDAGADASEGFWTTGVNPEYETALYGAAGVAAHEGVTRLLVERGADVNDDETPYHAPETYELGALRVLVESGRLTADSLVIMLVRKHDWHHEAGVRYLLENGFAGRVDVNRRSRWGVTALEHAIARDNSAAIVGLLLQHGADPTLDASESVKSGSGLADGRSAMSRAARRGRGDLLELFERAGVVMKFEGVERVIAACARGDAAGVKEIAEREPEMVAEVRAAGGALLAAFAGSGNVAGVGLLLELGVGIEAAYGGDAYFGIPPWSTALQVAAWRARHDVVRLLIARGAAVDARDMQGRTALMLAVKACVDSYWKERRSPESVRALLDAGASTAGVVTPCGYDEVDRLLMGRVR